MNQALVLVLVTMAVIALVDYVPRAFLYFKKGIKPVVGYDPIPRYVILPTVYGDISYLENIKFLKKYADKVIICTSRHETEEFYHNLRITCRKHGFRYIRVGLPKVNGQPVKNAYTIYRGVFQKLNQLGVRKQTPCLIMDADTHSPDNVNNLIRTFIRHELDLASLRCEAEEPENIIEALQAFEYRMAMDNRHMDSWMTSGAASLGRAGVYRDIFAQHSNFFAGGDIEIGKLAKVMGYKIAHIKFTFYTDIPSTIQAWFKQRLIWFSGGFRHHVTNIASFGWHHLFFLFYNSLLVYLLLPLRWIEVVNFPLILVALLVLSWIYNGILTYKRGWRPAYLLLPFYAFIQSMIILPIAFYKYIKLAISMRSLGVLSYDLSGVKRSVRVMYATMNVGLAVIVVYFAIIITYVRVEYWLENGNALHALTSLI